MRETAAAIALLLLTSLSSALVVGPAIYEQKDFGYHELHQFTYSLSADCNASVITAIVYNESNKPVQGANVLLSYVDFSTPLLRNLYTDKDGIAVMKLPGQVQLMRGMFILVIQKNGFQNKEVHFDLYPCFHNGQLPPKPPPPPKPAQNTTSQQPPPNPPAQNSTPPPQNQSGTTPPANASGGGNGTGVQPAPSGGGLDGICPGALLLPAIMFFKALTG